MSGNIVIINARTKEQIQVTPIPSDYTMISDLAYAYKEAAHRSIQKENFR